jgi:murein DD-endopeptidase MepM/ murein hydrolase activator NlpD
MNYKIQKGDTLSKIAKANNTTVAELQKLNNIKDVNLIAIGKSLTLPGQTKTEKPAATTTTKATTKPIVAESDNTKVNNPVTGMQFKQPVKEKTTVSKSVPYESGVKSSVLERSPNKKEQSTKKEQTKPAAKKTATSQMSMIYGQPATQDNTGKNANKNISLAPNATVASEKTVISKSIPYKARPFIPEPAPAVAPLVTTNKGKKQYLKEKATSDKILLEQRLNAPARPAPLSTFGKLKND